MSAPVTLLMAIHCHQPVGNFGFVFEEAFAKAYDPFLRVLERHPGVRLSLHYSGCLLDWLAEHRPEFLGRVRALLARGQVELLASGYYEPILPLLPEADRQGQIAEMRDALRRRFRTEASGLWLTERVWEPELPQTLARSGIRYTMVDTNQFQPAKSWLPSALQVQDESFWDVLGSYTTDYAGESVVLFPASKRLRYWMPFQSVEQTVQFLQRLRRSEPVAITFADDGEKFGLWPKTYKWVYEEGWLEQFFAALERERSWLATETFHDYLEASPPNGRVYLPSGSYEEMLQWSEGHFRNFFIKYPEANAMQQKMLRVSKALQQVSNVECRMSNAKRRKHSTLDIRHSALLQQATQHLYAGQCNCAYWHGVFGGLYLSHLRRAVYAHLIGAEQLLHEATGSSCAVTVEDADGDQQEEAVLTTPAMSVVIDAAEGGTLTEWSLYGSRVNLLDTLTRRHEPYHEKLKAKQVHAVAAGATPSSIHDALGVKEDNLAAHLVYDDHRRSALLDYALQNLPTLEDVIRARWGEQRLSSAGPFRGDRGGVRQRPAGLLSAEMVRQLPGGTIRKSVLLQASDPVLECRYAIEGLGVPVAGLEFNLSLRDERYLTRAGQVEQASQFSIEEPGVGVSLQLSIDPPATLFHFPVETVSESEEGLERTYQGLCVVCLWTLKGARAWGSRLRWTVHQRTSAGGKRPVAARRGRRTR